MDEHEFQRGIDALEEIRRQFETASLKSRICQSVLAAPDDWALPHSATSIDQIGYVPIDIDEFLDCLLDLDGCLRHDPDFRHESLKYRPFSFLEVGCGIGRNINIVARQPHLPVAKAVGIDVVAEFVAVGKAMYGLDGNLLIRDCLDFDYSGFDVVYFFRPFAAAEMQIRFEEYLMAGLRKGAILIAIGAERVDNSPLMMPVGQTGHLFKAL